MKFLKKIQSLPETKRKILFWIILILVGGLAFWFWSRQAIRILENLGKDRAFEDIETPEIENLNIDGLKQDWQELGDLKEILEQAGQGGALPQDIEELNLE